MRPDTTAGEHHRAAAPSSREAVERGYLLAAIVWQGGWLLADAELRTTAFFGAASWIFVASGASWLALIAIAASRGRIGSTTRTIVSGVDAGLLLIGAFALLVTGTDATQAISMMNLAVGVGALLLPARVAFPVLASSIVLLAVLLAFPASLGLSDSGMPVPILGPLYSACIAAAAGAGRALALASAGRTDAERAALERASVQAVSARALEDRMLAMERRLHESVLNTLTAIAVGGISRGPALSARCRDAAKVISSLSSDGPLPQSSRRDLRFDLGSSIADMQGIVDVRIDRGVSDLDVPDAVYEAIVAAVREALANTARHAGASHVKLIARSRRGGLEITVIDDGVGFDTAEPSSRFGVRRAIIESMRRVGGTASVISAPGDGTTVRVGWAPHADASPVRANALVIPVLAAIGAYVIAAFVLTLGETRYPLVNAAALVVAAVGCLLLLRRDETTGLPTWRVLAVAACVPGMHYLQIVANDGSFSSDWSEWSSVAGIAILFLLIGTGPWWAWIPALASWLIAMGDPLGELLRPGTMILAASVLFARTIRRSAADAARWQVARDAEDAVAAEAAAGTDRIRDRYRVLRDSSAPELLEAIASGVADPADPDTRARCADEERFVRSAMRLDPGADPLHELASELVAAARRYELPLEFDVTESSGLRSEELDPVRVACLQAIAGADASASARFTARAEGESMVVRLVVGGSVVHETSLPRVSA